MCTVNKSVHTKKVWKLIECTSYTLHEPCWKRNWTATELQLNVKFGINFDCFCYGRKPGVFIVGKIIVKYVIVCSIGLES